MKDLQLEKVHELMKKLTSVTVKLEIGSIKKLDENLIAEKKADGTIILYEVT